MAALVVQLTDGTTTIDFDSADHKVNAEWRPAIATRRVGRMGNQPRYNDVLEEMPITIFGTDVDDLIANEMALVNLLDKAQAHFTDEGGGTVLFKYRHQDSSLATPAQACVIGPSSPPLEYIGNSFSFSNTGIYRLAYLRFYRRGEWLGAEDGDASSSTANPGVMTATNTATALASPVRIQMTDYRPSILKPAYLVFSDSGLDTAVTASTATASGFTAVNDSANLPFHATNILRYTAPDTDWATSGGISIVDMLNSDTRKIGIFANVRNAGSVATLLKGSITIGMGSGSETKETRVSMFQQTDTTPQWHYLGDIRLPADLQKLTNCIFYIMIKTASAAAVIDIDAFYFVDLDTSQIIGLPPGNIHSALVTLGIDNRLDSDPFPIVYHIDGDSTVTTTANGDLMLYAQQAGFSAVYLHTTGTRWCATVPTLGTRVSNALTAVRRPAYLVPQ